MKKRTTLFICLLVCLLDLTDGIYAQESIQLKNSFSNSDEAIQVIGRGSCRIADGVFKSKDAYACFGEVGWKNYVVTFKARAPQDAEQVQIWAGFRAHNRFDRYIIGLKGGLQDDIYLSRMGYMGTDELLDIRGLDFHPVPGEWYHFKIEVCDNRIRVFLNNETLPRIDVEDENFALAPSGCITLGGGWIETEFDDLTVTGLASGALANLPNQVYEIKLSSQQKESKRKQERAAYQPLKVDWIQPTRTEISLDGQWLFLPDYEESEANEGSNPNVADNHWHLMNVPDFWNPIRIWLHGEMMGKFHKGVSDTYYQQETERCESYTFDYQKTKAAWYRQWIELPDHVTGKNMELIFDAVSKMADVYVNGTLVTSHIGMFGEIKADVSSLLKPGKNLVAVYVTQEYLKIENADEIVDVSVTVPVTNKMLKDVAHGFYGDDPAGIWQPVSLVITDPVRIEDVFIKPALDGATIDITLKNYSGKKGRYNLSTNIIDYATKNLFFTEESLNKIELAPGEEKILTYTLTNLKPRLWTPETPNLYDFVFKLSMDKQAVDEITICSGFRTFESKNGLLYLNGIPYWLRGGNHTPFALAPNDADLASSFYQIMKAGNMEVTRTHTTPYNKLWITAADKNGIGISHEGTWPWLMIHESMPEKALIEMWANEYLSLLKKYRNHPSILFWTINNEMKFYDNEPDLKKRREKMEIISNVVKQMRQIDPTRPICFDSNYRRNVAKQGEAFYQGIDDGDIDDIHSYINWYDHTIFKQFNGEFQKQNRNEGRPLISQEMSTGYPNNETGHPVRFYTLVHQNPQTLIGYQAYAFGNPEAFLKVQSFITGELAEALRRSNDKASGILHFALLTWFRNVYNVQTIDPYPTYYAMKRAMQPVLISAELWGRNFYAGEKIPTQIYIVNDLGSGRKLEPTVMHWELVTETGLKLASGVEQIPGVEHYKRYIFTPDIKIPDILPQSKVSAKLKLRLHEKGVKRSENEYQLLLTSSDWVQLSAINRKIMVVDNNNQLKDALLSVNAKYSHANSISEALKAKADLYIFSNMDGKYNDNELDLLRNYIRKGGKVLLSNSKEFAKELYPEYINGAIIPTEGDIVNMEIPESPVFDSIDLLELRYFNDNKRELPLVCHAAFQVNRGPNVMELANQTKIHGYINGDMEERSEYVKTIKGFPLLEIKDGGSALISTMAVEKGNTDPVAAKLLTNMIRHLLNQD